MGFFTRPVGALPTPLDSKAGAIAVESEEAKEERESSVVIEEVEEEKTEGEKTDGEKTEGEKTEGEKTEGEKDLIQL